MKEAIGHIPLYNFLIVFIVITFGFLSATLTYYKAFKVNSKIAYALEEFEGYNSESIKEINRVLGTLGYRNGRVSKCPNKKIGQALNVKGINHQVCIYESKPKNGYFNYGIVTYIYMDVPVLGGTFKIPVYTESERIFKFSS